jgi:hypothetical protein
MFKNIEQVLPEGKHIIKVFKANEWSESTGSFIPNTHKRTKPNKHGISGYMYNTDVKYIDPESEKERRCNLFAYDERKKILFDSGEIEVNVVPKLNKQGKVMLTEGDDGSVTKELTCFFNPLKPLTPSSNGFDKVPEYNNKAFERGYVSSAEDEDIPIIEEDEE